MSKRKVDFDDEFVSVNRGATYMSKRKVDFDDEFVSVKRSHKKKVTKEYRWYGVAEDGVRVFEGSGPPTKCFTREVYGQNATGDVDFSFCSNGECENIDDITLEDFEDKTEMDSEAGMLYRGPIPDPDTDEIEEYDGDIPEERELLDCEDDD